MKNFPSRLTPNNIPSFESYYDKRLLCYLRRKIYEWMISPDFYENNNRCFSLQDLDSPIPISSDSKDDIDVIIKELNSLGWKTRLAYGNSALFIYKEDENPCPWDFEEI